MNDAKTAIHVALTAIMAWLGIALAVEHHMFDGIAWSYMATVASENAWMCGFFLAAAIGIAGLVIPHKHAERWAIFLLSSAHGSVAMCFFIAAYRDGRVNTGPGTYGVIALLGYYLCWRHWR